MAEEKREKNIRQKKENGGGEEEKKKRWIRWGSLRPPPPECMRGRMRIPIFYRERGVLVVVSGRFPEKAQNAVGGVFFVTANGNQ